MTFLLFGCREQKMVNFILRPFDQRWQSVYLNYQNYIKSFIVSPMKSIHNISKPFHSKIFGQCKTSNLSPIKLPTWQLKRLMVLAQNWSVPLPRIRYFCLRPSAKDQGITLVVLVVLHHLVHFLIKRYLVKKYLPSWDSNRGPFAQQSSALPTELQKPC